MKKPGLITAIICIGLLANMSQVLGQDKLKESSSKHGLGAGAGFTTGYGLSYRYTPNKWGAQVNFAPYKDNETERYSVGLTFLYKLIENTNTSLYAYQGNHYYYNSQMQYVYNPIAPFNETYERVSEGYTNNGVGFGIEIIIAKRISFNLMAGFATYRNFSNINLTGETALYYKF
jgi:hypothetical protein